MTLNDCRSQMNNMRKKCSNHQPKLKCARIAPFQILNARGLDPIGFRPCLHDTSVLRCNRQHRNVRCPSTHLEGNVN